MPNPRKLSDRQLRKMVFSEPVQGEAESDMSFAGRYELEMDFPRKIFQDDSGPVPSKDPQWADLDPWGHYIDRLGLPRRFPRNKKGKHLQAPARKVSRGPATLPAWLTIDPKAPDPDDDPNEAEKKFPGPSVWWSGLTILQRRIHRLQTRGGQQPPAITAANNESQYSNENEERERLGTNPNHHRRHCYQGFDSQGRTVKGYCYNDHYTPGYYPRDYLVPDRPFPFRSGEFFTHTYCQTLYRQPPPSTRYHQLPQYQQHEYQQHEYQQQVYRYHQPPYRYQQSSYQQFPCQSHRTLYPQPGNQNQYYQPQRHSQVTNMVDFNDYPSSWEAPSGNYVQDPIYNPELARDLEEHRRIVEAIERATYANGFDSNMTFPNYGKDGAYAYPNEQGAFKDQLDLLDSSRNEYFNESSYADGVVPTHDQAVLNGNPGYGYPAEGNHQLDGHPMDLALLPSTSTVPAAIAPADGPTNGADFTASFSSGGIQNVPAGAAHPQYSSPVSEASGSKGNGGNSDSLKWPSKLAVQETPATVDPKCIQNTPPVSGRRPLRIIIVRRPKSASAAIRSDKEVAANTNTTTTLPQSAPAAQPTLVAQPNSAIYPAPAVQPISVAQYPSQKATNNPARGRQVKRVRRKRNHDDDDDEYVPGMSGSEKSPPASKRRRKMKPQAKSQS